MKNKIGAKLHSKSFLPKTLNKMRHIIQCFERQRKLPIMKVRLQPMNIRNLNKLWFLINHKKRAKTKVNFTQWKIGGKRRLPKPKGDQKVLLIYQIKVYKGCVYSAKAPIIFFLHSPPKIWIASLWIKPWSFPNLTQNRKLFTHLYFHLSKKIF